MNRLPVTDGPRQGSRILAGLAREHAVPTPAVQPDDRCCGECATRLVDALCERAVWAIRSTLAGATT